MNESMIRTVAKAVKAAILEQAASPEPNIDCETIARHAIKAMREPTLKMTDAATELWWLDFVGDEETQIRVSAEQARQIWWAMSDAALEEMTR